MSDVNTQQQNVPETFDFNETDCVSTGGGMSPQYANGLYRGIITKVTKKLCPWDKSNDLGLEVELRAIDATDQVQAPSVRYWLGIPVPNPMVPGHAVDDKPRKGQDGKDLPSTRESYFKRAREFIRAVLGGDTIPAFPKKKETGGGYIDAVTGAELSPAEKKAQCDTINKVTIEQLKRFYTMPDELRNAVLVFAVKRNAKGYASVQYVREDNGTAEVRTSNFTISEE